MTTHGERQFRSQHTTIKGGSHEETGKVCQDFSSEYRCKDYAIACVADGHGSDRYIRSDRGSKFAVETSIQTISNYIDEGAFEAGTDCEIVLEDILRTIIARWYSKIDVDLSTEPLTETELEEIGDFKNNNIEKIYGTTLVVGVIARKIAFGLQIGDGAFTVHYGSEIQMPMPEDPNCVYNRTTSLCDMSAASKFRKWYSDEIPDAITVSTDGLYTTFISDDDFKHYCGRMVDYCIRKNMRWSMIDVDLEKRAKSGGHKDDLSVSLIGFAD